MKAYELDEQGYYIGDIPFFTSENSPEFYTLVPLTESFYKPKFNGTQWVEGDIRENHVGKTVYSVTDKQPLLINELGPIPTGYTEQVPGEFDSWDGSLWITDVVLRNETLRQRKLTQVNKAMEDTLANLRTEYPESEIMSWVKQETEARMFLLDNAYQTPLMDLISESRGIDKLYLINKVIQKSDQYSYAVGTAVGRRQYLEDRIKLVGIGEEYKLDQYNF